MSDKFDDIIKNKLSSFEADYNPNDWNEMESMLDNDSNPGTPWLWRLSIIAFLLMGLVGALNIDYEHNDPTTLNANSNTERSTYLTDGTQEGTFGDPDRNILPMDMNSSAKKLPKGVSQTPEMEAQQNKYENKSDIEKKTEQREIEQQLKQEPGNDNEFMLSQEYLAFDDEGVFLNAQPFHSKNSVFARIKPFGFSEDKVGETHLVSDYPDYDYNYPGISKWRLNYGVVTGLSYSFLDDNLLPKLGYSLGFSGEIQYKGRLGISSGVRFTQQQYETSKFDCDPDSRFRCPTYYTATIKSIEIPIGLRYNYFRKNNWTLSATAGISNYIKLIEKFNYIFEPDATEPVPPRSNSFSSTPATSALEKSFTRDFTLTEEKRYHLSYSAGLGFEKQVAGQFALSIEPTLQVTSAKVGNKDARIVSYSMLGKLLFYPGR